MKKIVLIIICLIISIPALCATWEEIGYKQYVDVSSITQSNARYYYAWFKELNPGDWEKVNNKYHYYTQSYFVFDCDSKKMDVVSSIEYGLNGNILNRFDFVSDYDPKTSSSWINIAPDSIGEKKYNLICKLLR